MSFGDEIMASGHALSEYRKQHRKILITEKYGRPRWSDLWRGLNWIVQPGQNANGALRLANAPGCRPYISYPFTSDRPQRYSGWRARDHIGVIALDEAEQRFAKDALDRIGRPFVLLEPNLAEKSNQNKDWGWDRWQALADLLHDAGQTVVQIGPGQQRQLNNATCVTTPTFRHAAAVIAHAGMLTAVLPEGGLHHAAGALMKKVVVLFGGTIDPEATGYAHHINIIDCAEGSPCGMWTPCGHCAEAWARISPEKVAGKVLASI